ncbi:MAG TPA: TIGR00282 family metallophosphoesterase [Candidatus Syntrophosphaera sp.]|nr:TIGR00282 family metallophosphoesterase [Candidatus Syntrophosphaera sp.]
MIKLLFFGDIFGKPGRQVLYDQLPVLKAEFGPDFIIINGENLADGRGLTEKTVKPLLHAGVDIVTGGNHLWDRNEAWEYIGHHPAIVKPLNYPASAPGNAVCTLRKGELELTVLTLCGQIYMPPSDSPFTALERWFEDNPGHEQRCVLVDFHAESTAEKRALGWFTDGHISALIGTYTHIQTADEEILPLGTAYLTDAGMTGPHDSVIGVRKEIILDKFRHSLPLRYETSNLGLQVNAVYLELDPATGRALKIERVRRGLELSASEGE